MKTIPEQVGPYTITREIGRGGMGVVYLARDTKLDRDVAIKALPEELARDADRLARFEREARTLASLNHPNIGAIYGLEEVDGHRYLILEYVEGETLADRLSRGRLTVDDALGVALQLAIALEVAHEQGIIHRDLKPANIKLATNADGDDIVKVLDFGLAKAMDAQASSTGHDSLAPTVLPEHSPTIPGVLLGTAGYLSPEQARGRPVDKRTDIFAFGCVLYEMLTGQPLFVGRTLADSIAATLAQAPAFERLPSGLPPMVRFLLSRCLSKDVRGRICRFGDVRLLLDSADEPITAAENLRHPDEPETVQIDSFTLDAALCRQFERRTFDPRLIGRGMQYADNRADSDIHIYFIHGLAQDHRLWLEALERIPYRGFAPTQVGFEPEASTRIRLPKRDQVVLYRNFIKRLQDRFRPRLTILIAFSAGCDVAMQVLAEPGDPPRIDGLILLEGNTSLDVCNISGRMAALNPGDDSSLLSALHEIGGAYKTLNDWIIAHDYFLTMLGKMREDIQLVRDESREIVAAFDSRGLATFIEWFRAAVSSVRQVRYVVCEDSGQYSDIQAVLLKHLDTNCLGEYFRDDSIVVEAGLGHLDLPKPNHVCRYLDDVVRACELSETRC